MIFNIIKLVGLVLFAGGISASDASVGISDASIQDQNYMASFRLRNVHLCSGIIIAPKFILTSIQCINRLYLLPNIESSLVRDVKVHTGTIDKKATGSVHEIKAVHRHNGYTGPSEYIHNLAVVELKEPITFNARQSQISISNVIPEGEDAEVVEWVLNSDQLKKANVYIMTNDECHEDTDFDILNSNERFCVVNRNTDFTAVLLVNVSPLISNGKLIGIRSCFGKHCEPRTDNVYTNVYNYKDFISSIATGVKFDYEREHIMSVVPKNAKKKSNHQFD